MLSPLHSLFLKRDKNISNMLASLKPRENDFAATRHVHGLQIQRKDTLLYLDWESREHARLVAAIFLSISKSKNYSKISYFSSSFQYSRFTWAVLLFHSHAHTYTRICQLNVSYSSTWHQSLITVIQCVPVCCAVNQHSSLTLSVIGVVVGNSSTGHSLLLILRCVTCWQLRCVCSAGASPPPSPAGLQQLALNFLTTFQQFIYMAL